MIAPLVFAYVFVAVVVALYQLLEMVNPADDSFRLAIFWPLYAVRWFVVNLILAIRGI